LLRPVAVEAKGQEALLLHPEPVDLEAVRELEAVAAEPNCQELEPD
jgi:hypothetical protein